MDEEVDKNNIPYNGEGSEGNDQHRNKGFEIAINTFIQILIVHNYIVKIFLQKIKPVKILEIK